MDKVFLRTVTSIIALICCLPVIYGQNPSLSINLKHPEKFENKKLASEKTDETKFTVLRRFTQNGVTKFNWHFNANERLNEVVAKAKYAHKDDFTKLLPFYNYSPAKTMADSLELDSVIYRANAGILLHDLRNSWVDNMYMILGKAYFFKNELDSAYLTFQYINYAFSPKEKDGYDKPIGSNAAGGNAFSISTKEKKDFSTKVFTRPPSRNESFIWQIRTYLERDEFPEAAGLIETLKHDPFFPARLRTDLYEMQSYWFYKQSMYDSAAVYLSKALDNSQNKSEQARWEYLIAQLYELAGKSENAMAYYQKAHKHSLDPILEVYALLNSIRQNKSNEAAIQESIDGLMKMAKKDRYMTYRDIIYYTAAQIELERNNRAGAKVMLLKSAKAMNQLSDPKQRTRTYLQLGDLSFEDKDYRSAKSFYDSILTNDGVTDLVVFDARKRALFRIGENIDIITRQDSLQKLASMSEEERDAIIKKMVKKLRKEQGLNEEDPGTINNPLMPGKDNAGPVDIFDRNTKGEWYFYNADLKSKGFTNFKAKWGNRPNVDNWRRTAALQQATAQQQQGVNAGSTKPGATDGEINYESLKKNIPLTAPQLVASNDSIENALFQLGKAYMDGLEDYGSTIVVMTDFVDRFKYSNNRPEALQILHYCYTKTGNLDKAREIAAELKERYAGTNAEKLVNNPTAGTLPTNAKNEMTISYEKIYNLFIEGKFEEAMAAKRIADSVYSSNYWTPQLLYIQTIYFIRQNQDDSAKKVLQNIINLYPSSNIHPKAQTMLDVLNRRKEIEKYLTNLKIERPGEDSLAKPDEKVTNPNQQVTNPNQQVVTQNQNQAQQKVTEKNTVVPPPIVKKDSPLVKTPVAPTKPAYQFKPESPHYVAIVLDKVDPVFVNEAKNAFNRYNKVNYYNKPIDIKSVAIDDNYQLVLMSPFENSAAALGYLDKTGKIAATEIVPWLPAAKFSFIVITEENLELLKGSKDIPHYKEFLAQAFPGKF